MFAPYCGARRQVDPHRVEAKTPPEPSHEPEDLAARRAGLGAGGAAALAWMIGGITQAHRDRIAGDQGRAEMGPNSWDSGMIESSIYPYLE
jgi:hypothetical protein